QLLIDWRRPSPQLVHCSPAEPKQSHSHTVLLAGFSPLMSAHLPPTPMTAPTHSACELIRHCCSAPPAQSWMVSAAPLVSDAAVRQRPETGLSTVPSGRCTHSWPPVAGPHCHSSTAVPAAVSPLSTVRHLPAACSEPSPGAIQLCAWLW